ncbi:hypothetical protein K32_42250 [Kaistia sp. 32K]|nr:hypothetical protein K32_42250 [Kaistia sp. 32K]
MTSRNRRITQAKDIKGRAHGPPSYPREHCVVPGCRRPTQRSASLGLSETYCKRHKEHLRTHGHEHRKSYSKAELVPFRRAAREWFVEHREDGPVQMALRSLAGLMSSQGRSSDAYHQRSMSPVAKARNTLARLHEAGKTAEQLFLTVLTIQAAHAAIGPWGAPDWETVQVGKQAKKLRGAAGTHYPDAPSRYPRSEGLYLRHLGRMIEERASAGIGGDTIDRIRERARATNRPVRPPPRPPRDDTGDELRRMQAFIAALRGGSRTVTAGG